MRSFPAFGILFNSRGKLTEIKKLLETNSNLPGPRANLELGFSFASAVAGMRLQDWQWDFLLQMASASPHKAPENTPGVYTVFCAVLALGAQYGNGLPRPRRRTARAAIASAAVDPRWRVREAAAMALQQIGERDVEALKDIVAEWMEGSSPLLMRAVAAGLAHPPILTAEIAAFSLEIAERILSAITRTAPRERKDESFRVLRQGMGYALSVFVSKEPGRGFPLMRKCAALRDPDIVWIMKENLKKKRLSEGFAKEAREVEEVLKTADA